MGVRLSNQAPAAQHRWIKTTLWGPATNTSAVTAGKVRLMHFEVSEAVILDGVLIHNFAVVAGNVTVGVYGPLLAEETALNAPLAATSASTVLAGVNSDQFIDIPATPLREGRYYLAVEFSDAAHTFAQFTNGIISNLVGYYDRAGGYGALTDPCPAMTANLVTVTNLIRCVQ
jgi:hypothetical protein